MAVGRKPSGFAAPAGLRRAAKTATYLPTSPKSPWAQFETPSSHSRRCGGQFAVAILALLGFRVPWQLRMFLLTFAIVDGLGSILVVAVNYTSHFSVPAMWVAAAILGLMLATRRLDFHALLTYRGQRTSETDCLSSLAFPLPLDQGSFRT